MHLSIISFVTRPLEVQTNPNIKTGRYRRHAGINGRRDGSARVNYDGTLSHNGTIRRSQKAKPVDKANGGVTFQRGALSKLLCGSVRRRPQWRGGVAFR